MTISAVAGSRPPTRARWVGAPVATPHTEYGRSPGGRQQQHYVAVEVAGHQFHINDLVEIAHSRQSGASRRCQQQQKPKQAGEKQRRFAQVLSMWEDTFTGASKFRARWLVRATDLSASDLSPLPVARHTSRSICPRNDHSLMDAEKKNYKRTPEEDEVFLTSDLEDLDVCCMVKPVALNVTPSVKYDSPEERVCRTGPRLSHAFDASSGTFAPVESTDAVIERAKLQHLEALPHASRSEDDTFRKGRKEAIESDGWLLHGRDGVKERPNQPDEHPKTDVVACPPNSPGLASCNVVARAADKGEAEETSSANHERWEKNDSDHTSSDNDSSASPMEETKQSEKVIAAEKLAGEQGPGRGSGLSTRDRDIDSNASTKNATPCPRRRPCVPLRKYQQRQLLRPRRLALPYTMGQHFPAPTVGGELRFDVELCSPVLEASTRPVRPATRLRKRQSTVVADMSQQLLISGKRKRGVAKPVVENDDMDQPPLRTAVGKDFQADIPDLSTMDTERLPPNSNGACMVWRSVRDWNKKSRGMLAEYLHAANEVVQAMQARPGVPVHVRLGGSKDVGDRKEGKLDQVEVTGSYAVWAVTAGCDSGGVVKVACSEMAQTEVPRSAVQRVQCKEEALAVLVKTQCNLDNVEPALKMLGDDAAYLGGIQTWTLEQVRILEMVLRKEFNPDMRPHGRAEPELDVNCEDFIDLAAVSRQVPGKTPSEVLFFYYRYLAAAEPLTDVVYGPHAAAARRREELSVASDTEACAVKSEHPDKVTTPVVRTRAVAKHIPVESPATIGTPTMGVSLDASDADTNCRSRGVHLSTHKLPGSDKWAEREPHDAICNDDQTRRVMASPSRVTPPLHQRASPPVGIPVALYGSMSRDDGIPTSSKARPSSGVGNVGPGDSTATTSAISPYGRVAFDGSVTRASRHGGEVFEVADSEDEAAGISTTTSASASAPSRAHRMSYAGICVAVHPSHTLAPESASWATQGMIVEAARSSGRHVHDAQTGCAVSQHNSRGKSAPAKYDHTREMWEQGQPLPWNPEAAYAGQTDGRSASHVGRRNCRTHTCDGNRNRNASSGPRPTPEDSMFDFMAPCWRLVERAQAYLDQDQILYMKGLLLAQVKKPMSRDQLLDRVKSCLQEQDEIFAAFAKMFDRVDQPPLVPLYASSRRGEPSSMPGSYSTGPTFTTDAFHASDPVRMPRSHVRSSFAPKPEAAKLERLPHSARVFPRPYNGPYATMMPQSCLINGSGSLANNPVSRDSHAGGVRDNQTQRVLAHGRRSLDHPTAG